jgi:hypothetical protein
LNAAAVRSCFAFSNCPSFENYRAQFSRAAPEAIVESDSPICRRGNAALRRDIIGAWKSMLRTEMKDRGYRAVAAVGVVIAISRPVIVVSKKLQH